MRNGVVTLSGPVATFLEKWNAEKAAKIVSGVTADAVQKETESALVRHAHTDALNVLVRIQGKPVTFSGSIQSWTERQSAVCAPWNMPGVRNAVDPMALSL